jgi:hypothetical protein
VTAYTQSDHRATLAERRRAYEAEVVDGLLEESPEEREERLALVRAAQEMVLLAFRRMCEATGEVGCEAGDKPGGEPGAE